MNRYELIYQNAVSEINSMMDVEQYKASKQIDLDSISGIYSDLDGWDYCYAIAIGLAGIFITTNEKLAIYLKEIHEAASGSSGQHDFFQKMLGRLLHHKGDTIDLKDGITFKNRKGENADCLFHRLLWGHDILNLGEDNPFYLMIKQKGVGGVLQAVRHLLADTMSSQGLPMPGSSFLDYTKDDNEKISNYLIKIARGLSKETKGSIQAEKIYSHMFTIKGQDVAGVAVVKGFSEMYFKVRGIDDEIRCSQCLLISYAVSFFGQATYGSFKQDGVPYINIPLATSMIGSFGRFYLLNYEETKRLCKITDELIKINDSLIEEYKNNETLLSKHNTPENYIKELVEGQKNVDEIIDFFEED